MSREVRCTYKGGWPLPEKGVRPMGKRRWAKVLRFLLCLILVFLILMYLAPEAY